MSGKNLRQAARLLSNTNRASRAAKSGNYIALGIALMYILAQVMDWL